MRKFLLSAILFLAFAQSVSAQKYITYDSCCPCPQEVKQVVSCCPEVNPCNPCCEPCVTGCAAPVIHYECVKVRPITVAPCNPCCNPCCDPCMTGAAIPQPCCNPCCDPCKTVSPCCDPCMTGAASPLCCPQQIKCCPKKQGFWGRFLSF